MGHVFFFFFLGRVIFPRRLLVPVLHGGKELHEAVEQN